ncbi:MAG: hypothetical protein NTX17_04240 [Candidatus Eisenbacteria bacterium]|nr:hypothetical protein [Candidatus Eisenbacteria bacterium]
MDCSRVNTRLVSIAALLGLALLIPATALSAENYRPRNLIQAQYGGGESEFGLKKVYGYDGNYLGALFFTMGADGNIYIYDGVKGNIKVYGNNGAFVDTIKAVAWQVDLLFPTDMTLPPNGDIYILCETSDAEDRYRVFLKAAGVDSVRNVPVAVPWSFCRSEEGYPQFNSAGIVSDQHENVYLADWRATKSIKLVERGRVLPDSSQLSSLREGIFASTGPFRSFARCNSKVDVKGNPILFDDEGKLVKGWAELPGDSLGTDSLSNVYLQSFVVTDTASSERISKYSPDGRMLAVIDFPRYERSTLTYGKGPWIVGTDGSIYEMLAVRDSVTVRKWERVR